MVAVNYILKISNSIRFVIVFTVLCLSFSRLYAGNEQVINSLSGSNIKSSAGPASLIVEDQKRLFMLTNPYWNCRFNNKASKVSVVLRFDDTKRNFDNVDWVLDITYDITLYKIGSTPFKTFTAQHAIINYKKNANNSYTDVFLKTYEGALKGELKITNVTWTPSGGAVLPSPPLKYSNDIFLDLIQETDRYYNFTFNGANCLSANLKAPIVTTTVSALTLDSTNLSNSKLQLPIAWNYIEGAESYDVEWVFIDVANSISAAGLSITTPFTSSYPVDFSNATRVNVWQQHYEIPMAYPRGIIVYRVRAVGKDFNSPFVARREGAWSANLNSTTDILPIVGLSYIKYYEGLDKEYNWQYSASFAEDGKRKEVISYFDGSLRNRQTTTILNSDDNAVVAESKYDYQGRASVQMLPTPITSRGIRFTSNFNPEFNKEDFDVNANYPLIGSSTALVSSANATAKYYGNNTTASGIDAYIPDAQGAPYTQTRFKTDGTGRIVSQSGVGINHMLGNSPTNHDTKYYYGTPTGQAELDRLFGNEVGNILHYKKNMVVDANGQVSLSYLDQEGRTIATALAGETPTNLLDIDGKPAPTSVVVDILTGKNLISGNSRIAKTTILTTKNNSPYTFNYLLNIDSTCYAYSLNTKTPSPGVCKLCNDCIFDLEIKITDEEGKNIPLSAITSTAGAGSSPVNFAVNTTSIASPLLKCSNITTAAYTFNVVFPVIGSYQIEKIIKVSQMGVQNATSTFTNAVKNPPCGPLLDSIIPPPCNDCQYLCNKEYGVYGPTYLTPVPLVTPTVTTNQFGQLLSTLTPTAQTDAINRYNSCFAKCQSPIVVLDECALKAQILKTDMSPGGQYFDNLIDQPNTCSPAAAVGGINGWLNVNVPTSPTFWSDLFIFSSTAPRNCLTTAIAPANQNWTWLRNNWRDCFGEFLMQYHPEYCNYKFYCGDVVLCKDLEPGVTTFTNVAGSTIGTYNAITMKHSNLYDKYMSSDNANLFHNPLGLTNSGSTPTTYISNLVASGSSIVTAALPINTSAYYDPLFSDMKCNLSINCVTPSAPTTIKVTMQNLLQKFYTANASSTPIPMSIWYVLDNPDNIHSIPYGSPVPSSSALLAGVYLDNATINFFKSFHDPLTGLLSGTSAPSKYQLFKTLYNGYKKFILYGLYSNGFDCEKSLISNSYIPTTALPADPSEPNFTPCTLFPPRTFPHAQIRFPKNDGFEMMLANCPNFTPSMTALANFTTTNLASTCQSACEGAAVNWMDDIKTKIANCNLGAAASASLSVLASIKADLIAICLTGCDDTHPQGQSFVPITYSGVPAPPSSGSNFNAVINTYLSVAPYNSCASLIPNITIVHPAPEYSQVGCSCDALKTFAIENGLIWNPTSSSFVNSLVTTLNSNLDLDDVITAADVNYWISVCFNASTPTSTTSLVPPSAHSYPPVFICPISDEIPLNDPCNTAQSNSDAAYQNAVSENRAIDSLLAIILNNYTNKCLLKLDLYEQMTAAYILNEYQYSLYYYDQAGNLIKTVPPEGVHLLPISLIAGSGATINTKNSALYRANLSTVFVWPCHTMITNYQYNTLNKPTQQTSPDGGTTQFFYDRVGRLVISQNAKQKVSNAYSYTLHDDLSRITEVGEMVPVLTITQDDAKIDTTIARIIKNATKSQITRTYYDEAPQETFASSTNVIASPKTKSLYASNMMGYLRNRVSCVTFIDNDFSHTVYNSSTPYYKNASHYSYDMHGNVKSLYVENVDLAAYDYDVNLIDYDYDLISGKVNEVHYNAGKIDQFHHQYEYDADNRLTVAYTSRNGILWEKEAKYFYYKHGPLARVETGDKQVQATDYAYTIQGWIKGINSTTLDNINDIGKDGYVPTVGKNLNSVFANDPYSYSLGYFNNDYVAKNPSIANSFVSNNTALYSGALPSVSNPCAGLYNGNIANMATSIYLLSGANLVKSPQIKAFRYDQLNRIKTAKTHESITSNLWAGIASFANKYNESFTYDFNGNIERATRYDNASLILDNITYNYTPNATSPIGTYRPNNKLMYVDDAVGTTAITTDIEDQAAGNYSYDAIGNLTSDVSEKIDTINWTVYGKIKSLIRNNTTSKSDLEFVYDAQGNRIQKIEKTRDATTFTLLPSTNWKKTYYVRDAQGNVMTVYKEQLNSSVADGGIELQMAEQHIYGSSRLGILTALNNRIDVNAETTFKTNFNLGSSGFAAIGAGGSVNIDANQRLKVTVGAGVMYGGVDLNLTSLTPGKTYEVSYSIDKSTAPNMNIKAVALDVPMGYAELYTEVPLEGFNSYKFTAVSANNIIKFQNETSANPAYDFYIDNIVIKEVIANRTLGDKNYELSNHLGNVLTVISDRKLAHTTTPTSGVIDYYTSDILSANDYYAFGMAMPGRNYNSSNYSYGFGGKRKDDEIAGNGNYYDYDARMYDPRLGRTPSGDPHASSYPWQSPYSMFANNPILYIDKDGRDFGVYVNHETKTIIIKATYYTVEKDKARAEVGAGVWNAQKNLQYSFKGENGEIVKYGIQFQLDVKVENSSYDVLNKGMTDKEGNTFLILPNETKMFGGSHSEGITKPGHENIFVKESVTGDANAQVNADGHEMGHTMMAGDGHDSTDPSSIMYESTSGKDHGGLDITKFTTQKILKTAGIGSDKIKLTGVTLYGGVNNAEVHQDDSKKPTNFNKGNVTEK